MDTYRGDATMTNLASVGGQIVPSGPLGPSGHEAVEGVPAASSVDPQGGGHDDTGDPSDGQRRRHYRTLRIALGVIRLGPVLILAGLIVAMRFLSPVFLTTGNAGNLLSQTAAIAVLAIGQLMVILTRGIDLSVGSTLALASVLGAIAYAHGSSGCKWVGTPGTTAGACTGP